MFIYFAMLLLVAIVSHYFPLLPILDSLFIKLINIVIHCLFIYIPNFPFPLNLKKSGLNTISFVLIILGLVKAK
jgi:hypothetical protein